MLNHDRTLKALLDLESDTLCYGFVAQSTGEVVAEAGCKQMLPEGIVAASLRQEAIVSRYEECERHMQEPGCNLVPRGYALDRVSAVIGIPAPDALLVLFGHMPEQIAATTTDFSARVAWYWSHRLRVWERVKSAYMPAADMAA